MLFFILLLDLFCIIDILNNIVVITIRILVKRLLIILSRTIKALLKIQK